MNQDAAALDRIKDSSIDLVLTGPPYHNIEKYDHVPGQASSIRGYTRFLKWYAIVATEMFRVTRPGGFCAFKVANWRKNGRLVLFTHDTLTTFQEAGFRLHDELICVEPSPLALAFNWRAKWRDRYVHKAHQTLLVFRRPQ